MKTIFIIAFLLLMSAATFAQDKVDIFAQAIARAEGYYTKGTIPNRCKNPGDIRIVEGYRFPGQVGLCRGGHIRFRTDADGWAALRHQIEKALSGESHFYTPDMTLRQVAKKYAADYRNWLKNVCHNLGDVPPSTTLREYFDLSRPNYVATDDDIDFLHFDFLQGEL